LAVTVTLCSHRNASHFWIILLLVPSQADHQTILHSALMWLGKQSCRVQWR
jgi:hypothetical protein